MLEAPLTLPSGLTLPNRIAKAAMTEALADEDNQPGELLGRLYARWSAGGVGLLITGNAMIDRRYLERTGNVVLDERTDRAALARWATAACSGGARAIVQLSHPGRQVSRFIAPTPLAPSAVEAVKVGAAFGKPRALTEPEIEDIIARFASAAAMVEEAGFDGVEIHAAHGYLLSQFLSPRVNQRSDTWGGSLDRRARLLLAVIEAVRAGTGPTFTVGVKLNSSDFQHGGFDMDASLAVLAMLNTAGVDFVEISGGNYESPRLLVADPPAAARREAREAYFAEYAERARGTCTVPLMLTGGLRRRSTMEAMLAEGSVDLIGLARPLAFDPDIPRKLLDGSAEVAEAPVQSIGIATLAAAVEAGWYGAQITRLAHGQPVDPNASVWGAVWDALVAESWRGRAHRRRLERASDNP